MKYIQLNAYLCHQSNILYPNKEALGDIFVIYGINSTHGFAILLVVMVMFAYHWVIFGNKLHGKFCKEPPVTHWNDARKRYIEHAIGTNGLHHDAMLVLSNFMSQISGKMRPVNVIVDDTLRKEIF